MSWSAYRTPWPTVELRTVDIGTEADGESEAAWSNFSADRRPGLPASAGTQYRGGNVRDWSQQEGWHDDGRSDSGGHWT